MGAYLLAHDLGTSGNKAVLYDLEGNLKGSAVCGYDTLYPRPSFVEQRAGDWWRAVCDSTKQLLAQTGIGGGEIAAVSFSGQMMGCLPVGKDGEPLRDMIIWADTRSGAQEGHMIEAVGMEEGYRRTGHRLSASYTAAKTMWVRDNEPEIYEKTHKVLHAKDYIVYRLTGEYATDYSDASATNCMDIEKKQWADDLIAAYGLRRELLPELHASTDVVGKVTAEAARACGLMEGTPVVLGGGDGCCACVGAGVVDEGSAYAVLGSSSWIMFASRAPQLDPGMRTFNFVHLDPALYTPTGTMQAAGMSYQWYREAMCEAEATRAGAAGSTVFDILDAEIEKSPPGAKGLLYLPYLLGERSPRWNHKARGAFIGMDMTTEKKDFSRAVLEGVGYNLKVILDVFEGRKPFESLITIGGGAKGKVWLQILSDIWQKTLDIPEYLEEATSMGAAVCAGVGVGAYKDFSVMKGLNKTVYQVKPNPANAETYGTMYRAFNAAYDGLCETYELLSKAN